jgi:hypothetical protein
MNPPRAAPGPRGSRRSGPWMARVRDCVGRTQLTHERAERPPRTGSERTKLSPALWLSRPRGNETTSILETPIATDVAPTEPRADFPEETDPVAGLTAVATDVAPARCAQRAAQIRLHRPYRPTPAPSIKQPLHGSVHAPRKAQCTIALQSERLDPARESRHGAAICALWRMQSRVSHATRRQRLRHPTCRRNKRHPERSAS